MGLETGTTIAALNSAWPLGTDPRSQGDDHIRLVKAVVKTDALSKAAGGTIASALTLNGVAKIESAAPQLQFVETDQTSPAGRFRLIGNGAAFVVTRNTAAAGDFSTSTTIASFEVEGTGVPVTTSIITRDKGDFRYLQLGGTASNGVTRIGDIVVGGLPTGAAVANTLSGITGNDLVLRSGIDTGNMTIFRNATGADTAIINPAGTAVPSTATIMTREKGDFRYAQVISASLPSLAFNVPTSSIHVFQINSVEAARINVAGTASPNTTTVITREKGDLRYAPHALMLAAVQALADSATVAQLRDALVAALSAPPDLSEA